MPEWAPAPAVHSQAVTGKDLLDELIAAIRKFVMLDEAAALVVALYVVFTHTFEVAAETNPFLRVISATGECGKSNWHRVRSSMPRVRSPRRRMQPNHPLFNQRFP